MPERPSDRGVVRWAAPGRVNLIGEHTDYNDGFVLPFAIEGSCTASVRILSEPVVRNRSVQRGAEVTVALADLDRASGPACDPASDVAGASGDDGWARYVLGVPWALRQLGHDLPGLSIEVDSSVPVGSGLSSSAALVCSTATALDDLLDLGLGPDTLLAVSRSAENDFVGAPTGGMDQLASLRCSTGNALFCDMRSLDTEQAPFDPSGSGLTLLVVNSNAPHRHADGEYGARREGCRRAAEALGVPALRDVGIDDLDDALHTLAGHSDDTMLRYTRHIVTENNRVLQTVERLRTSGPAAIGDLLTASHVSMRDDFRITVPEIDVAVDALLAAGAIGARMTGGGFGGCVIALVDSDQVAAAVEAVRRAYAAHGFTPPDSFTVPSPAAGAHRVGA